jgi:Family of unknown function (DUF5906)
MATKLTKVDFANAKKAALSNIDPHVAEVNEKYALVRAGTGVVIIYEDPEFELMTIDAFRAWHANKHVFVKVKTANGEEKNAKVSLAKYWLEHAQRRDYHGIVFDPSALEIPGKYNLWRGFPIKPVHKPGACDKFLAHLRDNICSGDEKIYRWVFGWFADIFQHPAPKAPRKKSGTALVLRGPQGVGKTKVGEVFRSLLGEYFTSVAKPSMITGTFNIHLKANLLFQAEEAFWAGSKEAEGIIKDLVTGDWHWVTPKYVDAIKVRNYSRLLVNGNNDWLVPGGLGERRFAVLDVGEDRMQDHAYFMAIDEEMENGGREALMYEMLHFDLSKTNIRDIPETLALLEQKLESLDAKHGWWVDFLNRGVLPWGCSEPRCVATETLFDDYIAKARRRGVNRKALETSIGMFITKIAKPIARSNVRYRVRTKDGGTRYETGNGYEMRPLKECRAMFAKMLKHSFPWPDPEADWVHEQEPPEYI